MEYQASKSDIDFEFDSSDSDSDDVSISTNPSEPESPVKRYGVRGIAKRFEKASLQQKEDGDNAFLNGIGDDGSDGGSDVSIGSEELMSPKVNGRNGADKHNRRRVSDEFGPPMVIPLKTDCLGDDNQAIDTGTRNFNRRPPVRTKSGEGMTSSSHSAASGRRRPPPRTKSGEGIVQNDDPNVSNHRRRPPPRTKSGSADGIRRRPPARTKSGEGGTLRGSNEGDDENHVEQSIYYEEKLPDHDSSDDDVSPTSPLSRQKSEEYRELALKRNSARRQRSSDMLGAMRDATRNLPARSQSTSLVNGRRRGPSRTKSGGLMALSGTSADELASPGRKPLRRKAPPRTKSGGTLRAAPPLET